MRASSWSRSPQEVDPLGWFAGPRLPIVFAIASVAQAVVITLLYWPHWSSVALQFAAMPFFLAAAWVIAARTQPNRPRFSGSFAALALAIATVGLVVSAIGTANSTMPVEQWWPGIALGATLASLAPYSSARQMVAYSIPTVVVIAAVGYFVFSSISTFWPGPGIVVISAGPVVVAAVAAIVFSHAVAARTTAYLETAAGDEDGYTVSAPVDVDNETGRIARVSARVAPFLEGVARAGVITNADRTLAGQIARGLRAELVSATNRTWLDEVAIEAGIVVTDPGRLAGAMNESQRTALRALLAAATEDRVVDRHSLLIELRGQPDGSIAVALSIDVDLPEGRRLMLLAPYYLTLGTTVDDLSWDDGRSVLLNFRIPGAQTLSSPDGDRARRGSG